MFYIELISYLDDASVNYFHSLLHNNVTQACAAPIDIKSCFFREINIKGIFSILFLPFFLQMKIVVFVWDKKRWKWFTIKINPKLKNVKFSLLCLIIIIIEVDHVNIFPFSNRSDERFVLTNTVPWSIRANKFVLENDSWSCNNSNK